MDKLVSKEIINKRAAERLGSGRRATGDGRGRGHSGAFGAKNTIRQGFGGEALPRCGFRGGKSTQMRISRNIALAGSAAAWSASARVWATRARNAFSWA